MTGTPTQTLKLPLLGRLGALTSGQLSVPPPTEHIQPDAEHTRTAGKGCDPSGL